MRLRKIEQWDRKRASPLLPLSLALGIGIAWIISAMVTAQPAPYTIDGFVYYAMIDAFARDGSLLIENGFETYRSAALAPALVNVVDGQLVSQYPGGWGMLAAPAYLLGGVRGIIVINACASAATIYFVWRAALAFFDDKSLAGRAALIFAVSTFAVEYAFGVWPHAVTMLCVTAAVAAMAAALRRGDAGRGALIAGLLIGLGINLRVDALFATAPLAAWLLLYVDRPYRALGLLTLGLVPGTLASTVINWIKFGIPVPVTYGGSGGSVALSYYVDLLPLAVMGGLAVLSLGLPRVRAVISRPTAIAVVAAVFALAMVAVPLLGNTLLRTLSGAWTLVVDMQAIDPSRYGASLQEDGTIRIFGVYKKALLQSMPYLVGTLVLLPALLRGPDRAALGFCFLVVTITAVPFAYGEWHGGKTNNMRYFLNFVPVLAILAAVALREAERAAEAVRATSEDAVLGGLRMRYLIIGLLLIAGVIVPYALGRPADFVTQVSVPSVLVLGTLIATLLVLARRPSISARAGLALRQLMIYGMAIAFVSAWAVDTLQSQLDRQRNLTMASLMEDVPEDALTVLHALEAGAMRLNRPPALTAQADYRSYDVSPELEALVATALTEGRPVIIQGEILARQFVEREIAAEATPRYGLEETFFEHYDLTPPASSPDPS